mmetsp:Transcript_14602/g.41679  ORF Transcript_14602/g.41679 Transcript_14602/m.41679 type:complete len:275 (-) Transcript_14602:1585-2409(-)
MSRNERSKIIRVETICCKIVCFMHCFCLFQVFDHCIPTPEVANGLMTLVILASQEYAISFTGVCNSLCLPKGVIIFARDRKQFRGSNVSQIKWNTEGVLPDPTVCAGDEGPAAGMHVHASNSPELVPVHASFFVFLFRPIRQGGIESFGTEEGRDLLDPRIVYRVHKLHLNHKSRVVVHSILPPLCDLPQNVVFVFRYKFHWARAGGRFPHRDGTVSVVIDSLLDKPKFSGVRGDHERLHVYPRPPALVAGVEPLGKLVRKSPNVVVFHRAILL